jgi:uncharacterized protein (UPF0332 family)
LIFERLDKASKSHRGVKTEFARLAKSDPGIDKELPAFLARAYWLKSVADYETGSAVMISSAEARDVITKAEHFVKAICEMMTLPP